MVSSHGFKFGGGVAAILTGLFLFIAHVLNFIAGSDYGTVLGQSLVFIAHIIAVFAFIGIYDSQGRKNGTLGLLGMVLSTVGTIIVSAVVYVEIASASGVNVSSVFNEGVPRIILIVGPLMFVVGMLCLGISTILVRILPRWGGSLLVIGNVVFAIGSVAGNAEPIISVLGSAITCGGFIWLGIFLIKMREEDNLSY
ncbi:hypothetical protein AKG34_19585 [Peribacillus butanolivorans]|uniref:hypothetical protein n=1 Tax=Peribacillus butanolivorans TaxID=421767 RepID=UPI0006A74A75|nr:hypothetical protein [Peribacillus butanolivorans]KON70757.1 hypothetical protein AKG34_19585 [Peribacillus butanolivorans]